MFEEIKPERIHSNADICICSLEAKQDITESCLPFPVVILLLRKSSTCSTYKKQLENICWIISHMNKLGHMSDMIDLYNLWKSLSEDILYLTQLISEPYVEKITNEIQTLKPSFSQEYIVLNLMKEMKTSVTDHFERFHEDIQTLKEGMDSSLLKLTFDKTCEIDKEVKDLRDQFDYKLLQMKEELRNGFQQELLALKMERQSQYRQILESKHLANAVKPQDYHDTTLGKIHKYRSIPKIIKDMPYGVLQTVTSPHLPRDPLKDSSLDTVRPSSSKIRKEDSSKHRVIWQKSEDNLRWIGHMTLKRTILEGDGRDDSVASLGLKVAGGRRTDAGQIGAVITKVNEGSIAYNIGHLRKGDEVIQFNEKCLQGTTSQEVQTFIYESKQDPQVELKVHRSVRYIIRSLLIYIVS
ncbi:Hypothetical predicted protein [Mytilus galloprovincialis]|uniref:PDZ domain-containing protein n=1 Tax=Mytilus galloprovincialis TaxID=29158 RepID=A0A8B6EV04_MYTGA|nr:Hypothetical predicted protein [Mytilus galloprovincialis]